MITGTVILIVAIFGGGITGYFNIAESEVEIFTLQNVEKKIRAHVEDEDREAEVLAIFKEAKIEIKSLSKELAASGKAFRKLQKDKNADQRELEAIFKESETVRKNVQRLLVDKRLRIRELLSEQEWEDFTTQGLQEIEDSPKKFEKAQQKIEKLDDKILRKLQKTFEKKIKDPERLNKANGYLDMFKSKLNELTRESVEYAVDNNKSLRDYSTKRSLLEDVFEELNESRVETFIAFLEMRRGLAEMLPEKEWKGIAKAFDKIL